MSTLATSPVVLASASPVRASLLRHAGLLIEVDPGLVDEAAIRHSLTVEKASPTDIATALAELKAHRVSQRRTGMLVIGADQILVCEGRLFEKPETREKTAVQLRALSGKSHELISAVCLAREGSILWHHVGRARLTMRVLSEAFLNSYLNAAGDEIYCNVGGYGLEGLGAQLFSRIEGDYFTILGLPLLPLLDILRENLILPR